MKPIMPGLFPLRNWAYGVIFCWCVSTAYTVWAANLSLTNPNRPARDMRLFFIHQSVGQNWLQDDYGRLGVALRDNGYFVSDSYYGWGPESIGDTTDIGSWYRWFRSAGSGNYLATLYSASDQNCPYSRLENPPSGPNQIVMFKSGFPNSALQGSLTDPIPAIASNPLREQDAGSEYHTLANAKGIYLDLLNYFATRPDKLFVAVTAPPLSDPTCADKARAFNQWLVHDWLAAYPQTNVFVFDFYNVLTSNGGSPSSSDAGFTGGNHHRWRNGTVEHKSDGGGNVSAYASSAGDDHPSEAGSQKATAEFVPLLNAAVNAWQASLQPPPKAPRFVSAHLNESQIHLSFTELSPGSTYLLQRNTNSSQPQWTDVATLPATAGATNWSEPVYPQAGCMFYRIKVN